MENNKYEFMESMDIELHYDRVMGLFSDSKL
jgi:hypothetical protein